MFTALKLITNDVGLSMSRTAGNTLNFENCSNKYEYGSMETSSQGSSSRGMQYYDNIVLSRLIDYIIQNATPRTFSVAEMNMYRYRPKRLSLATYGVVDYWWLILAINQIPSVLKFNNFSTLLMPDQSTTQDAIDQELFANPIQDFPAQ